ncbi:MAG: hypothetical protein R2883_03335 [Caldisericia bacterium]
MTPYKELLLEAKTNLAEALDDVLIFIGLKQAVPKYPACCLHLAKTTEKPETFAGGKNVLIPLILTVMVQGLTGKEDGYLKLSELTAEIESVVRNKNFLSSSSSLVATEFIGNPIFSDNSFILQSQLMVVVEVKI